MSNFPPLYIIHTIGMFTPLAHYAHIPHMRTHAATRGHKQNPRITYKTLSDQHLISPSDSPSHNSPSYLHPPSAPHRATCSGPHVGEADVCLPRSAGVEGWEGWRGGKRRGLIAPALQFSGHRGSSALQAVTLSDPYWKSTTKQQQDSD